MENLLRFRRQYPLAAAMIAAALIVVLSIGLLWQLVISDPLLPSALYGIGRISHLVLWKGAAASSSGAVQNAAVIVVALMGILWFVVTRMFLGKWEKHADIQITFRAPCGETFQGTVYQFFGLMGLRNVGKEDFLMIDWSIETEWGMLHASADAERYQSLKSQLRTYFETAYLGYASINLLKAGSLRDLLIPVLLEQTMGKAEAVSPSQKVLVLEGQKQRLTFRVEYYEGEMIAIPMKRQNNAA